MTKLAALVGLCLVLCQLGEFQTTELPETPTTVSPPENVTVTPSVPTTTTSGLFPPKGFCKDKEDGLYPHETDRNKFYECYGGRTFVMRCGPGTVFDDSCKCCNWP